MDPNETKRVEKDELTGDNLISGHEYDGIQELDNRLPKWWLWLFYVTIIIAVVYFVRFEILGTGPTQEEEYQAELTAAAMTAKPAGPGTSLDASNVTLLEDFADLEAGKAIYDKHCGVCHLAKGQGLVGPNLTDNYWIHGCRIGDVFRLIMVGVPEKGMISWKDQLTPVQVQQVSSYILAMKGTNPPNPKEAQGELCQ